MRNKRKSIKTPYEYYDEAKNELSVDHLIHAPVEGTFEGILLSLQTQLETQNKVFDEDTFNHEINEINEISSEIGHVILLIQEGGEDSIPPDTIVVLSFRLGVAIGRQEGLGYLAPLVRRLSELTVKEVSEAKLGQSKGTESTKAKFSYPTRLAKILIPEYAIKYPYRLNFEKIDQGVKAELRRSLIIQFDEEKYRTETGKNKRPEDKILDKHINNALTELGYQ